MGQERSDKNQRSYAESGGIFRPGGSEDRIGSFVIADIQTVVRKDGEKSGRRKEIEQKAVFTKQIGRFIDEVMKQRSGQTAYYSQEGGDGEPFQKKGEMPESVTQFNIDFQEHEFPVIVTVTI